MPRPRKIFDRRERILKSAGLVFRKYGRDKTTIDDIAAEAQISKGSVYLEFSNKEAILAELIREFLSTEAHRLQQLLEGAQPPYLLGLKHALVSHIVLVYKDSSSQTHSAETVFSFLINKPELALSEEPKQIVNVFLRFLELAKGNNEVAQSAPLERTVDLLYSALASVFPPYISASPFRNGFASLGELEKEADDLLELIFNGIVLRQ